MGEIGLSRRFVSTSRLMASLLAASIAGYWPTPGLAARVAYDYYIAPAGSDSEAGTRASPWRMIEYASAKLTAGKTLCARGGVYYGQAGLIWKSSGTASAPVTFKNYPWEKPVFDGQLGDTGTAGDFLVFSNNSHVVVDGITARHFAISTGTAPSLFIRAKRRFKNSPETHPVQ